MANKPRFNGEWVKLGDICEVILGQSPSSSSYNEEGKGLPFFQGNADFGDMFPISRVWCDSPKKLAQKGDILLSVRAPIGALNVAKEECCIGRGVAALRPKTEQIDQNFFRQQLLAKRSKLELKGTGSTFKAIGKRELFDFPIITYSMNEQIRIAKILCSIQLNMKEHFRVLELLESLVKSRFIEMFGDPLIWLKSSNKVPLGSACWIGSSKRVHKDEYASFGIPFFRSKEIVELCNGKNPSIELFIEEERYKDLSCKNGSPKLGDLLITAVGTIGSIWIVNYDSDFYFKDGNLIWIKPDKFNSVFLKYQLDELITFELEKLTGGTAYKALTIEKLSKMEVVVPPLSLQEEFAAFVAEVDKLEFAARQSIEKLQMLYDSLAQDYFGVQED